MSEAGRRHSLSTTEAREPPGGGGSRAIREAREDS
jgi:hypothetical protein